MKQITYQDNFEFSGTILKSYVISQIFLPVGGKVQKITTKHRVKRISPRETPDYQVSRTHLFLDPETKAEKRKQTIATIFESTRIEGRRYVTVVPYEDLSLDEAKAIAQHLGLLSPEE